MRLSGGAQQLIHDAAGQQLECLLQCRVVGPLALAAQQPFRFAEAAEKLLAVCRTLAALLWNAHRRAAGPPSVPSG